MFPIILPWLYKNVFKRILQRSVRIGFDSDCVRRFRSCFRSVPGLSRWAVLLVLCLALACQIMPGGVGFYGFSMAGCSRSAGGCRDGAGRGENAKKMYDNLETESKPTRLELEKSEKNRRNLRLIQTCDFFILCILYIIFYNVPRRDVNFYFITFSSSFLIAFFLLVISEILLLRLFCRLVSLLLRFADSLLTVPMATPFRTFPSCSGSVN